MCDYKLDPIIQRNVKKHGANKKLAPLLSQTNAIVSLFP